jgi:predicted CxxxxCH...CXXCH cytochrome family protein
MTNVTVWTSMNQSHLVKKIFISTIAGTNPDVKDRAQYNPVPLEPASANWAWQTGPRYELNAGGDTNLTNNIVLDSSGQTRCLSCHGVHYTDSSSGTVDQFGSTTAGDGYLLKRGTDDEICHACHRTNANTPSPGEPGYSAEAWNNAIKPHSAEILGTCSNATYVTRKACIAAGATWTPNKWSTIEAGFTTIGWGIESGKYGKFVCRTCHTGHNTKNIYLTKQTIRTPDGSGWHSTGWATLSLDFRTMSGTPGSAPYAMGDDTNTHATSTMICQVCHSRTAYHKYNQTTASHNNATNCKDCHSHKAAFSGAGGCSSCHGNPPITDWTTPPDGLAWSTKTGSTTAGAHNTHNTIGIVCLNCHYNSVGSGPTHNANKTITLGFYNFSGERQGGSYDGQSTVSYDATATSPVTTVSATGLNECSNIYCHGSTLGDSAATDITPIWSSAATGACGTCHGATSSTPPQPGSHPRHAGSAGGGRALVCTVCHYNYSSVHVNNRANVSFDNWATYSWLTGSVYDGTTTVGDSYGRCSNLYCHSNAQGSGGTWPPTYAQPTWGSAPTGACGTCHLNATIASGSHLKHVSTVSGYGYTNCTSYCHSGGSGTANHADWNIDVSISTIYGGSYSQVPWNTPGGGYGNCSSTYCHSTAQSQTGGSPPVYATITWGTTVTCASCHKNMDTDSTAPGSHVQHAQGVLPLPNYGCSICHSGYTETTVAVSTHVNNSINLSFSSLATGTTYSQGASHAPANGYGNCTTSNCHGGTSPTWGSNTTNHQCTKCHGLAWATTSWTAADLYRAAPGAWRTGVDTSGQIGTINDNVSVDPQVGAHDAHLRAMSTISNPIACRECHLVPVNANDGGHIDTALPAELTWGSLAKKNTGATPPEWATTTRTCSNIYCHSGTFFTNAWSTPGQVTNPTWTTGGYLNNASWTTWNCTNRCHGYPPGGTHPTGTNCYSCHGANYGFVNTMNSGFTTLSMHMDGISQGGGSCLDCHNSQQGIRRNVVAEFSVGNTGYTTSGYWGHKKAQWGSVSNKDCGVCHMEGNAQSGSFGTMHQDGKLNFRDPDTGGAIGWASFSTSTNIYSAYGIASIGVFSRNTASSTLEPWAVAIQINLCLKCHDADGALSTLARVDGNTAPALRPFNNTGTVLNVYGQFWWQSVGNQKASYHPVLHRQNNAFAWRSNMEAPWTSYVKARPGGADWTSVGGTAQWGHLITCWDCHNDDPVIGWASSRSVTAHGNVRTLRKPYDRTTSGTQLCLVCHKNTTYWSTVADTVTRQLSAWGSSSGTAGEIHPDVSGGRHIFGEDGFTSGCLACHSSAGGPDPTTQPARPRAAEDTHGYNWMTAGGGTYPAVGGATVGARPFSFLRTPALRTGWRPRSWTGPDAWGSVGSTTGGYCQDMYCGARSDGPFNYYPAGVY